MPILIILGSLGVGTLVAFALASAEKPVPDHEPDLPPDAPPPAGFPKSTGFKLVDKILPLLKQAADSSGIPLGLLIGWIAKESGGKIGETTKYDELGLFQLMPDERAKVGYTDRDRMMNDYTYSINAGLALIGSYMKAVDALGVATKGSSYYWRLVKLGHSMGSGALRTIVNMAQPSGDARTWSRLENFALAHVDEILHATKHSPEKWFPFVDKVYDVGAPFGFGSSDAAIVGGQVFVDIIDPLDALTA